MLTVTALVSVAVPVNAGLGLLERGFACGFNVTVGGFVSTTKVTGVLLPSGLPEIELFWTAIAVKVWVPLASVGLTGPEPHASPTGFAVTSATGLPSGRSPS